MFGKAVVSDVNNYYRNQAYIDLNRLPENAEATQSVVQATLTEGAIGYPHNKLHGLSVQVETNHVKLPAVVDGFASEGIIQFFFEETQDENGFNIYILDET